MGLKQVHQLFPECTETDLHAPEISKIFSGVMGIPLFGVGKWRRWRRREVNRKGSGDVKASEPQVQKPGDRRPCLICDGPRQGLSGNIT